jgi:hypothetical protein
MSNGIQVVVFWVAMPCGDVVGFLLLGYFLSFLDSVRILTVSSQTSSAASSSNIQMAFCTQPRISSTSNTEEESKIQTLQQAKWIMQWYVTCVHNCLAIDKGWRRILSLIQTLEIVA